MKKYFIDNLFDIIVIIMFSVSVLFSLLLDIKPILEIVKYNFTDFFIEMISFLPFLFILIGLFDVWIAKEAVAKHVGEYSGVKGTLIVILLATLQAGPLYGAFPVAHLLWKKGCSIRNVFIYLGAFTALKLPMVTFEISFLGLKFSLLRTIISIPVFVTIGFLMERYIKGKHFVILEDEEEVNTKIGIERSKVS
jgi:uncharacterized membrane protein YraQ (UPF0718 family)